MGNTALNGAVFSFMDLVKYIRAKYCKVTTSNTLSKYRSIDAPYDRDEVVLLDDIGRIQTIEIDGIEQKVLSNQILKNASHQLHIPFLSANRFDAEKFQTIINCFALFEENYKLTTLSQTVRIFDDENNWLVYKPKKSITVKGMVEKSNAHYVAYCLNDKNEPYKIKGKFVGKNSEVYKRFELFINNYKIHNENGWAAKVQINKQETFFWLQNNQLHNMDGPAIVGEQEKLYYTYGRLYNP